MIATYAKVKILKGLTGNESGTAALCPNCFMGLLTSAPVDDMTVTAYPTYSEVSTDGTGYERAFIGEYSQGSYSDNKIEVKVIDGVTTAINKNSIYFGECVDDSKWAAATYFGLFNSATDGNLVAWGMIVDEDGQPKSLKPAVNSVPVIRAGQFKITLE